MIMCNASYNLLKEFMLHKNGPKKRLKNHFKAPSQIYSYRFKFTKSQNVNGNFFASTSMRSMMSDLKTSKTLLLNCFRYNEITNYCIMMKTINPLTVHNIVGIQISIFYNELNGNVEPSSGISDYFSYNCLGDI